MSAHKARSERMSEKLTARKLHEPEPENEENDERAAAMPLTPFQHYMQHTPWWATSVAFHGLIILCLYLIQWSVFNDDDENVPIVTEIARLEEQLDDKEEKKIIKDEEIKRDMLTDDTVPEDVVENKVLEEQTQAEEFIGDPDMLSDVDLGGDGHVGTMGLGGGGMAGMFGRRGSGGRFASKVTQNAVGRGLEWLRRHQCADGGWGTTDYADQCTNANTKCKRGTGTGDNGTCKPGLTGLAAMCFLGAGYTHKAGKYKEVVRKGLDYILSKQNANGSFSSFTGSGNAYAYSSGFCALALAEAYGMTRDPKLKQPLKKSIDYVINAQNPGAAWRYRARGGSNDTSVSAAFIMALKDAKMCGIKADYKKAFDGVKNWFARNNHGQHKGLGGYGAGKRMACPHSMTAVVMLSNQFMGMKRTDPAMKESAEYLSAAGATWRLTGRIPEDQHSYYVYYGTLAMFQYGGDKWKKWDKEMKEKVLQAQIKGGCADGSWVCANGREVPGFNTWVDGIGGKVFTTSLGILTLEVYYRYSPLFR